MSELRARSRRRLARFENSRVRGATLRFYQLKGRTELLRWGDFDIGVAHEVETFAGNTWVARKGNDTPGVDDHRRQRRPEHVQAAPRLADGARSRPARRVSGSSVAARTGRARACRREESPRHSRPPRTGLKR